MLFRSVFSTLSTAQPGVQAGTARILGVTDPKRSVLIPDVPPLADTVPGYASRGWYGLLGPANLPRPVVDRLHAAMTEVMANSVVQKRMEDLAVASRKMTPAEFTKFVADQVGEWAPAVKASGAKLN